MRNRSDAPQPSRSSPRSCSRLGPERLACGGLVTPNGTVSLLKTTTLAAYHEGVEHYVTSFEFAGEGRRSARSSRSPASRPT